ncbi:DUF3611 family protein [Thermoleptolyngbya sichuanensis A183]|uniref:DUF3611 family protein n=1 Tax=Thermoleptolyngbya sichuanensis A183 TaxID=2737172 RepID=A0A6M8BI46_9CYAN|nr:MULTISPECIES: DUF3611 family protein [Thermoleptolyngbya]QKD83341.1 DUF3611 family protein [Thermoleptolyngbya sichuanensis A183]
MPESYSDRPISSRSSRPSQSSRIESSYSLPPAVQRVALAFRRTGWISFWAQLVPGVISAGSLIFASFGLAAATTTPGVPSPTSTETGTGAFFSMLGLIALAASVFWAFRYARLGRRLQTADTRVRPKRGEAFQLLRVGLMINLAGMLLTFLGAQAIIGSLVIKASAQGFAIFSGSAARFVNPLDMLLVLATTNINMAHFIGIVASLWLLRVMSRS